MGKDNSLDKFVERYPTYIEALDMIDNLKAQLKTAQELLAKEMGNSNIIIDNLQKEMKTKLNAQREHYENKIEKLKRDNLIITDVWKEHRKIACKKENDVIE